MGCSASRLSESRDTEFLYTGQAASEIPRDVTRVRADPSVKEIPHGAFSGCKQLKEVELCEGLERINARAFKSCASLERIEIPSTVREIHEGAFYGCDKLEEVELPDGIERIHRAFYCCASLRRINVPSTVRAIEERAFFGCVNLEEVKLSDGLERINDQAFYYCRSLKLVSIPSTVQVIEKWAFQKCSNLLEVELCEGLGRIGGWAFRHCQSLKRISIPSTVQEICAGTFEDCANLSEVELRGGLRRIGDLAFFRCLSLVRIMTPSTVETIGDGVFQECAQLEEINLCEGLEHIGKDAFKKCESLKRISLPSTAKINFDGAFSECRELMTVEICAEVEKIDKSAFEYCSSLRNVAIPSRAPAPTHFAPGCYDLLRVLGCSKNISDALESRFAGLPLHKLCYYQSQNSIEVVLERIQCIAGSNIESLSNEIETNQDCLGMTPLHILACSTRQNLDLYKAIIANQPKSLITEDKWGCLPIFYTIWGNAPEGIIHYLIESHKIAFLNFALNWDKMVETMCRTRTSLDSVQRLIEIQQTFFPGQSIDWQKVAQELSISCLVRCKSFEHFESILRGAVEAFSASQARQELIQSLQEIEGSAFPDSLAILFPYQNRTKWRMVCEELSADDSLKLFRVLAKCCFSERLDAIGVLKWKNGCKMEMKKVLDKIIFQSHQDVEASFDAFQSRLASCEQEYRKYRQLKDAMALLELALWKFRLDELKSTMQPDSLVQDNDREEKQIADMKGQCLVRCGADVIIPNVLKFLIGN